MGEKAGQRFDVFVFSILYDAMNFSFKKNNRTEIL